jgi:signal transduction histidine kinase
VTILCFFTSLHFISENIILNNFAKLEETQVTNTISQVQAALTHDLNDYQSTVNSWAQMDQIITFVKNQQLMFGTSTQELTTWADLGINYVLVFDNQGKFITGFGFNLTTYHEEKIPQSLLSQIENTKGIWNLNADSTTNGLMLLPTGTVIVASAPIKETGSGAVKGALVMARYFDSEEISSLSTTIQLPVTLTLYPDWIQQNGDATSELTTFFRPINTKYITGYYVLKDLTGQPIALLGVTMTRDIYIQGIITVNYIDQLVVISFAVFSIAIALLLELVFLIKISKLNKDVSGLSKQNNSSKRLQTIGNDEIATLSKSINGMLDEIENNAKKLQKTERFSAIGELATMVAHDLRNPLQSIAVAAFYLKRKVTQNSDKDMLRQIDESVRYSDKIINDLLDYSRQIRLDLRKATPQCLFWKALSIACVPEKITLVDELSEQPLVQVDIDSIIRVFINLITNAVDAMPNGGKLIVRCKEQEGLACFQFIDTGEGISPENQKKLFQPLFTTKAKGMGFGLSICKRIVDAHGGKIVVESTLGKGTVFNVFLPLA